MTQEEKTKIEERIVDVLKTVYDPEIPVNIYDLGLIYRVEIDDDGRNSCIVVTSEILLIIFYILHNLNASKSLS